MKAIIKEWPQFFTATNLEWKKLLRPDKYKGIIIDSLRFLVTNERIKLYAFVMMSNHLHLIWQMCANIDPEVVQRDFLKYTAQKIKADLTKNHPDVLGCFRVDAKDRKYQFWERNPFNIFIRILCVPDYVNYRKTINIHRLSFIRRELIILRQAQDGFLTHYRD